MDVTARQLKETYSTKDTEELIVLRARGDLTDVACAVLDDELRLRGVSEGLIEAERACQEKKRHRAEVNASRKKNVWLLICLPVLFGVWAVWNGSAREARLDRAVDHSMAESRDKAMQKYMAGEILNGFEFILVAGPIVQATQSRLPIKVDGSTTWESISIGNGVLRYGYTLDTGSETRLDAALFRSMMHANLIESACVDRLARTALVNDVSVVFSYKLTNGEHLSDVAILKPECSAIKGKLGVTNLGSIVVASGITRIK